jgi:hypothetical protein
MYFPDQKLIHWLCVIAFSWSVITPSMAQAFAQSADGSFLTMELCLVDGSKKTIHLDTDTSDAMSNDCPYCGVQSLASLSLLTHLQFATPSRSILTPSLYLESTKTLFTWVKLPSQGPPRNTRT